MKHYGTDPLVIYNGCMKIDELEAMGIVSGYSGSKAREVLVDHAYLNEVFSE